MKKLKRIITSFVSGIMLVTAMSYSATAAQDGQFKDVNLNDWYYEAVTYNVENDILQNISDDYYEPNSDISEDEFLSALFKMAGSGDDEEAWIKEKNVTENCDLDDVLTREEMLSIANNALRVNGVKPAGMYAIRLNYSDLKDFSDWAIEPAMFCTINGIIQGNLEGKFYPKEVCTRAEAAKVFEKLDKAINEFKNTITELYNYALEDSKTIDDDELMPVTAITKDSPNVTWNEAKDRVLMLTWNKYPDSYKANENTTNFWGEVWVFTDKDFKNWYAENKNSVSDWDLRLKQLLGLSFEKNYTHFSAVWVKPEDLIRPAYVNDISVSEMNDEENIDDDLKEIFESYSFEQPTSPWTRIGYTYDWADNNNEFGLSEFVIKKNSDLQVEYTYTTDEFLNYINQLTEDESEIINDKTA